MGLLVAVGVCFLLCLGAARGIPDDVAAGRLVEDRVICPDSEPQCLTAVPGVVVYGTHSRRSTITTWVVDTDAGRLRIDDGAWSDSGLDWEGADVTIYVWHDEAVAMEDAYGERMVSAFVGLSAAVFKGFLLVVFGVLAISGIERVRRVITAGAGWLAPLPAVRQLPFAVSAVLGGGLAGAVVMWFGAGVTAGLVAAGVALAAGLAWRALRRTRVLRGESGEHAAW